MAITKSSKNNKKAELEIGLAIELRVCLCLRLCEKKAAQWLNHNKNTKPVQRTITRFEPHLNFTGQQCGSQAGWPTAWQFVLNAMRAAQDAWCLGREKRRFTGHLPTTAREELIDRS